MPHGDHYVTISVKNIPVKSLSTPQGVMDHCSSPPAFRSFSAGRLEGSTHVRFSRGGGVFHRIAGQKLHLKKSKPAVFPKGGTFGMVLLNAQKYRRDMQLWVNCELMLMIHSLNHTSRYFCLETKVTKKSRRLIRYGSIAGSSFD